MGQRGEATSIKSRSQKAGRKFGWSLISSPLDAQSMLFLHYFTFPSKGQVRKEREDPTGPSSLGQHVPEQQMVPQRGGNNFPSWTRAPGKLWVTSNPYPFPSSFLIYPLSPPPLPQSSYMVGTAKGMSASDNATTDHRVRAPVNTTSHSLASLKSLWRA